MNIPKKMQVFDQPVHLSSKDEERLAPLLSGWTRLAAVLSSVNEPDLKRMVVMELMDKRRRKIVARLLQRLGVAHSSRIDARVWKLLPPGPPTYRV